MLSNKVKTKKVIHWVIELAIWFLIFIVLANVILFIKAKHDMAYNTYQIFMPDVDGVIVGSAVNMMGVPIGYVDRVKIIDNEVFVQFTLNKKDLESNIDIDCDDVIYGSTINEDGLDALKNKSNTFFLWIFEGSLLESEYSTVSSTYPTGNIGQYVKSYGYSSQHTLYDDSFYAAPSPTKLSDISSPIYSLTSTMTSIYQSGTSSYLYYLGSLIVLNNQFISQSMYADSNGPILIPYYCPYYQSRGSKSPYTMGIFPAFVGGFGSVTSMSNFGNKGLDGLLAKRINYKQFNRVILSDIKMVQNNEGNTESPFYNTIRFSHPSSTGKTLSVWNGYKSTDNENINDIIDSFIFFFTSKVTIPSNVVPTAKIPSTLSSLYTVRNYNFYAFGIKFSHALLGTSDNDISVDNGSPDSTSNTNPYLSIVTDFILNYDAYKCSDDQTVFCPYNIVGYWGLSSKHDMINFFTNYQADENKFLIDLY